MCSVTILISLSLSLSTEWNRFDGCIRLCACILRIVNCISLTLWGWVIIFRFLLKIGWLNHHVPIRIRLTLNKRHCRSQMCFSIGFLHLAFQIYLFDDCEIVYSLCRALFLCERFIFVCFFFTHRCECIEIWEGFWWWGSFYKRPRANLALKNFRRFLFISVVFFCLSHSSYVYSG